MNYKKLELLPVLLFHSSTVVAAADELVAAVAARNLWKAVLDVPLQLLVHYYGYSYYDSFVCCELLKPSAWDSPLTTSPYLLNAKSCWTM